MQLRTAVCAFCFATSVMPLSSHGAPPRPIIDSIKPADYYAKGRGVRAMEEWRRSLDAEGFSRSNLEKCTVLLDNSTPGKLAEIDQNAGRFIAQGRTSGNDVELLRELVRQLRE